MTKRKSPQTSGAEIHTLDTCGRDFGKSVSVHSIDQVVGYRSVGDLGDVWKRRTQIVCVITLGYVASFYKIVGLRWRSSGETILKGDWTYLQYIMHRVATD